MVESENGEICDLCTKSYGEQIHYIRPLGRSFFMLRPLGRSCFDGKKLFILS